MQRRQFLQTTIGAAAVTAPMAAQASAPARDDRPPWLPMYDETLAASTDLELLGIPRSWWHIHHGLHPFSPERTLIIPERPQNNWCGYQKGDIGQLLRQIRDDLDKDGIRHTEEGVCQIVHAASSLTQIYRAPEQLEDWSKRMASWLFRFYPFCAEGHLWISPLSWPSARETVKTMNGVVDWWLILIPGGIEVNNWDGTRTHVLITPVFARYNMPRFYGDFWDLMAKAVRFPAMWGMKDGATDSTWLHVSRMDRKRACLFVNQRIAQTLTEAL
jgi:hypothetical protein